MTEDKTDQLKTSGRDIHHNKNHENKVVSKPPLKQLQKPCNINCVHQCTKIISGCQRQQILKYFCNLGELNLQQLFVQKCVEQGKEADDKIFHRFFFTINGRRIRVCKLFFLSTLDLTPSFIVDALNIVFDSKPTDDEKYVHPKIIEGVINHIKSIPRIISCEIDSKGEREYIESSINVQTMYQLYIRYCKDNNYPQTTYEIYQGIFASQNEVFKKCRESLPLLGENEVTIITLKADEKTTESGK